MKLERNINNVPVVLVIAQVDKMAKTGSQTQAHKIFSGIYGRKVSNRWEDKVRKAGLNRIIKHKSDILGRWVTKKDVCNLCGIKRGKFDKLFYKYGKTIDEILSIYGVKS